MKLYIRSMQGILGGKQFHITLLNDKATVKSLKKKICQVAPKHDIPTVLDPAVLQVEYEDEVLKDNRNLAYYNIKDNDYLYVSMHSAGGGVTVIVNSKEVNVTVGGLQPDDTIFKLKETIDEICPNLEPPATARRICYRAKTCPDDSTLDQCKIGEGTQVQMK
mmetsp:Transcript_30893/g.86570  ORF Transcript_30893/g.86570 Transcript_30893/m.86570 type:complete len:163 (-) Transcript_30893:22-510(-)|eukprot:CAMPEP_0119125610 /NCGR_PEP_ID=MMETSP1310-20130426/4829_1 /TAXON_ID=464262 /ORGANISM="Genus nov. species nov., Strain RCC2339" /LENGTH=162 /DNA_ID=CAMNT_0007115693 /DNA_START=202 /DNA_END=690 /DNA_ORIENTATION=+